MKKFLLILTLAVAAAILCSCGSRNIINNTGKSSTATPSKAPDENNEENKFEPNEYFTRFDQNYEFDPAKAERIDLSEGTITISEPGTYILEGTLKDGRVIVAVDKEEKVKLVFNNVDISSSDSSAVYVKSADKVSIVLPEGTVNSVSDGKVYSNTDEEANGCIFSKDDLSINGSGTLNVHANYNNGISTKNDLRIAGGNINITAVKNALKGNDSVAVCGGKITVFSAEDGIKSDSVDFQEGYVYISGGDFDLTCNDDGIQASSDITITGGSFVFNCEGKKINSKGTQNTGDFVK